MKPIWTGANGFQDVHADLPCHGGNSRSLPSRGCIGGCAAKTTDSHGLMSLAKFITRFRRQKSGWSLSRFPEWRDRYLQQTERWSEEIAAHIAKAGVPLLQCVWLIRSDSMSEVMPAVGAMLKQRHSVSHLHIWVPDGAPTVPPPAALIANPRVSYHAGPAPAGLPEGHVLLIGGMVLPDPLLTYHLAAATTPNITLVYCDHFEIGSPPRLLFKPEFSPVLMADGHDIGPCFVAALERNHWPALARAWLQGTESLAASVWKIAGNPNPSRVSHVPFPLYGATTACPEYGSSGPAPTLADHPTVSVIIPTRDGLDLLEPCLASIEAITAYPRDRIEIIVVDNGSVQPETLNYLAERQAAGAISVIRDDNDFNFSRLNNAAARQAQGEILVCLNNDTIIIDPAWLHRLVHHATQADVGIVGAKLLYEDRTLQHGGVVIGLQGLAIHSFRDLGEHEPGYMGLANRDREISVVTGACLAVRRAVFEEIGGFDEALAVAFNDVSLCLAAIEAGYRNIYVAQAALIHLESKSRGFDLTPEKRALARSEGFYTRRKFNKLFRADPYYSPNLCHHLQYHLALPPRGSKPWQSFRQAQSGRRRILILLPSLWRGRSSMSAVALAQAKALAAAGHEVTLGVADRLSALIGRIGFPVVRLGGARIAAEFAWANDIDVIVTHDLPHHSVGRHLAADARLICVDHHDLFSGQVVFQASDSHHSNETRFCMAMADAVLAAHEAMDAAAITQIVASVAGCSKGPDLVG